MDAQTLQNLIAKGMGVAGQRLGAPYAVYRPRGVSQPTAPQNRVVELCATFSGKGNAAPRGPDYGQPLWCGCFDASYTQAGDYLMNGQATYFIVRQWPGLPVQCVLTNRVVTIVRPLPATQGSYSGFFASPGELVIAAWPASLLESGGHSAGLLQGETRLGSWNLLLPPLPVVLQLADVVTDDLGANYVVGAAEQSSLGWRVMVRQLGA
jgi:hypothetical protein